MHTKKIHMPKLGESVTEGTITSWLVQPGDHIEKYDPIAEVMTDKVTAEVPSSYTGKIKELLVNEGETVDVDELIAYIETEDVNQQEEASVSSTERVDQEKDEVKSEEKADESPYKQVDNQEKKKQINHANKMRYSPAVLSLASEHDVPLDQISGSGRGGRITRKDVQEYIERPETRPAKQKEKETSSISESPATASYTKEDVIIPVSGVRKTIADNMVRSKTEIPHAWMTVEVDVTDLVNYRNKIKDTFKEREGYNLTYFAFFIQAVAQALKEYPMLNSTWQEDKIIQRKDVNISIAVAAEDQLFVPVIQHANEKSITGIAKDITELAQKARDGKLTMADMQGGTFTVNNTGTFGSVSSMGIINHPQAAILQVESIVKRPVIIQDMFAARQMVNLSLSLDHRILDGLVCGKFLQRVKQLLENMNEETVTI